MKLNLGLKRFAPAALAAAVALTSVAVEDCSVPVRPGSTSGGMPFWNGYATFFRYAPSFAFGPVAGAARYRFTLTGAQGRLDFEADSPEAPLSPVWSRLGNGLWTVSCDGLDAEGKPAGEAGSRTFVKTAPFSGAAAGPKRPYREAAKAIYSYMTSLPAMTKLLETGIPDQSYQHNAYPSKTHAAHIEAMLDWAKFDAANSEKAHDLLFLVGEAERCGMRPWIWSDYVWQHRDEFFNRMPKSVLQSNWHYDGEFDFSKISKTRAARIRIYEDFDKAGFDQVPTGSNWARDTNFASTVKYCREVCSPDRLKGFLMTTWHFTLQQWEKKNLEAVDQVGAVIAGERNG